MMLTERHLQGEKVEFERAAKISADRLLVGVNLNVCGDELYFCSRFSMALLAEHSPIKDMISASIPPEVFTVLGDTKESLAKRYETCQWLDPIHVHQAGDTLVNGDPNYKCPMRRTVSMSEGPPRTIEERDCEDYGRSVLKMFTYACHEMPVQRWSSRVLRKQDYALMLECWRDSWS